MRHALIAAVVPALTLAAGAFGATETVTINVASPSAVDLTICQDLPLIGGCDADASPLAGFATFRVDTTANTAELLDFFVSATESLDYIYTGFNSEVNATAPAVDVFFDQPAPAGPVPLGAGDGAFEFVDVGVNLAGDATVTGNVFLVGDVNEMLALGDFGPFASTLSGTLTSDGLGNYTLAGSFSFDESTMGDVSGVPVTTTVMGTIVIEGTGVAVADCPADIDGDGDADPDDIAAFVANFIDAIPGNADVDGDGDEDPDDIAAFVSAFVAGC